MKKAVKVIVTIVIVVIITLGALLSYVKIALPKAEKAPDLKIEITAQRLDRGKYLANHVSQCVDCHSTRDFSKFAGPIDQGRLGAGGEKFDQNMGLPGVYYAPNITPYNLKSWTDGEIFRTITTGVTKDGKALFPIMPYLHFGQMDKEDIYSIIAYIRTLPAIKSEKVPSSKSDFPMNFILNTLPTPAKFTTIPSPNDEIAYGKYLVNAANCSECHTPREKGEGIPGMDFAGGSQFKFPDATITSANITPDLKTGIGAWDKELFVSKFQTFGDPSYKPATVTKGKFQTIMPWTQYGSMKKQDLEAIYAYLRTVKPVSHLITRFEAN